MRKWIALVAAGLVVLASAACGGGSNTKTFKGPDGQEIKVSGSKSLPDSFPNDFPIYSGADYQGGVQSTQQGVTGFYATWETGDSLDKVRQFYEDKFKDGAWKSTTTVSAGDGQYIGVQRTDDASSEGFISIAASGGKTVIGVLVGKNLSGGGTSNDATSTAAGDDTPTSSDAGSADTPEANATLPADAKLPSGYPSDRVPLPDGAKITSASSISSGGQELYTVEFYAKDDAKTVSDYFKGELPKHDWQNALTSESNGEFFLNWSGSSDESVTVTVQASDVSGYGSKTSMLVTIKGS